MGAFSDKNSVFYEGYKIIYNNERLMFKDNSAKNLFSDSTYYPNGTSHPTGTPITQDPIVPNYITDVSYLFFRGRGGDEYIYPNLSENVTNASHLFAFKSSGMFGNFNPAEGREGMHYPNSIENAAGMFKCAYLDYPIVTNFMRNCPSNIKDMNNTFFHAGTCNNVFLPIKDENNEFVLGKYENFFDIWKRNGYLGAHTSNYTYYANTYYNTNNEDKRFLNTMIPDSVEYMNGTFALSSIGMDWYDGARYNNVDFHLPNNLKDASFAFFNTSYTSNYQFNLPDSLTEANYMFASAYGYNFPNKVHFGNGLRNAVGMFAQLAYGSANFNNVENKFPGGLPNSIVNASMMFSGVNISDIINIPRSVEDASFFLCTGGFAGYAQGNWNNNDYIIPNTVKNIDFAFANMNISPNNNNMQNFLNTFEYNPQSIYFSSASRYNNTHFIFEEGSQLESLKGMLLGCNLNRPLEIPNTVKDISFLLCAGGTNYGALGGEFFFNNILKENVENAAWAFCYGYINNETNIYMPANLKDITGMFSNLYVSDWSASTLPITFVGLENTQVENAGYFLNGTKWNRPINFPLTIKNLYKTFNACQNFVGQYDGWTFNLAQYSNLENCDYIFSGCNNYNIPTSFPSGLTSLEGVFNGCDNFNQPIQLPNTLLSAKNLFGYCYNFDQYVELPSSLVEADYLFSGCRNFNYGNAPLNFASLENLISMKYMFNSCSNLNKVIDEQNLVWPPHIEDITGIFNNCPNVKIDTFVVPGSVKTASNLLTSTTINNSIIFQNGISVISSPFVNLKGAQLGSDGNYSINSIIFYCGNNLNVSLSNSMPTFNNTNVNNIIFRDGNLGFYSVSFNNYNNSYAYSPSAFFINNSSKFNGNIFFSNISEINGFSGYFGVVNCSNFNKPLSIPAITYNFDTLEGNYQKTYIILGEDIFDGSQYDWQRGNYFYITENVRNNIITTLNVGWRFEENNEEFKSQLNNLINTPSDIYNLLNNYKNYPVSNNFYKLFNNQRLATNFIVNNCHNFNSSIYYGLGTQAILGGVYNCYNFNNTISIPSTATDVAYLIYNCPNFDKTIIVPSSAKNTTSLFQNCIKFGSNLDDSTAPLLGEGIEYLDKAFENCIGYNQKTYFPNSLISVSRIFAGCTNFNQEVNFSSNAVNLSNAFNMCSKLNSNVLFGNYTQSIKDITGAFKGTSLFNKEVDFNCLGVNNAAKTFEGCSRLNSNIKNCNLIREEKHIFNYMSYDFVNNGIVNNYFLKALSTQQHNVFYFNNFSDAIENNNFYNYKTYVNYINASGMFNGCSAFNPETIPNFTGTDDATELFRRCQSFDKPVNLYYANRLGYAFQNCSNFNQPLTFSREIIGIANCFEGCYSLVNIPKFEEGIRVTGNADYSSSYTSSGSYAFSGCSRLGIGQEGYEYAIHFNCFNTYKSSRTSWCDGYGFFAGCSNLNVPIIYDNLVSSYPFSYTFASSFLAGCNNFNSDILILNCNYFGGQSWQGDVNDYHSNLEYEVIERGDNNYFMQYNFFYLTDTFGNAVSYISGAEKYNDFFEIRDENNVKRNYYIGNFFSDNNTIGFITSCNNFNYPIQQHFIPLDSNYCDMSTYWSGRALNNEHVRSTFRSPFITHCPNFNQPILSYFFDSPTSLALNSKIGYLGDLYLSFPHCTFFNQSINGNFTQKGNILPHTYTMNFENCMTPGDISINFIRELGANGDSYPYTSSTGFNLQFANMKIDKTIGNRNLYLKYIYDNNLTFNEQPSWSLYNLITGSGVSHIDATNEYYETFVPENIYIDAVGSKINECRVTPGIGIFSKCNFDNTSPYYYIQNDRNYIQNNQTIKNLQFFPSVNNLTIHMGRPNYQTPIANGSVLNRVDCGYISLWNSFLGGRTGNVNYINCSNIFVSLYNVHEDLHFDEGCGVLFKDVNGVFDFMCNCDVNIYINTSSCFNNVRYFAKSNTTPIYNSKVNVFIKGGLTFYNSWNFFNCSGGDWGGENNVVDYYIGQGTVFYQCYDLPKSLGSDLNLQQFQGISSYNFTNGSYNFSGDLDFSTTQLQYDAFMNTQFRNGNSIIFNPSTWGNSSYNSKLGSLGGCRNIVINRYYTGGGPATANLFGQYYARNVQYNIEHGLVDATGTFVNLYVNSTSSLASYIRSNAQQGFNIIMNTGIAQWDNGIMTVQELEDRFFYTKNVQNIYTQEYEVTYYNIVFY